MPLGDVQRLGKLSREGARAVRARVAATGFEERQPVPAETSATGMPEELRVPLIRWALERDTHPAARLALLFQHLVPIPRAAAESALGADAVGWLESAGAVAQDGAMLRALFRLNIVDGVCVWSDDVSAGPDAVMTPGPTTVDLITTMPAPISGAVLDLGAGPGTLALIAAKRGADRAMATDISERATALTRANAAFNELRVDVRTGDMYEAVGHERFDWIFAQPPYVTHPPEEANVTFLHGGAMGDELAMRVIEGAAAHLRRPGVAFVLFDSPVRPKATLTERVRAAAGPDVDLAILEQPGLGPDRQALGYAALADPSFGPRFHDAALRYRRHLAAMAISDVAHALVVVRHPSRSERAPWTETLTVGRFPGAWSELGEFIRGIDLAVAGEDAIASAHVRPRAGAAIVLERAPGADRAVAARSVRFSSPGLALDRELTEAGGVIFDLLAAGPSVASAIERFAAAMERPATDVRPLVTSFVRDCLVRALLVPD